MRKSQCLLCNDSTLGLGFVLFFDRPEPLFQCCKGWFRGKKRIPRSAIPLLFIQGNISTLFALTWKKVCVEVIIDALKKTCGMLAGSFRGKKSANAKVHQPSQEEDLLAFTFFCVSDDTGGGETRRLARQLRQALLFIAILSTVSHYDLLTGSNPKIV